MIDKLESEERRYEELMHLLGTAEVQADQAEFRTKAKALAELEPLVQCFREYRTVLNDVAQTEELATAGDSDMRDLAREELKSLVAEIVNSK